MLDSISSTDADVRAAIASIKLDAAGMRQDFEKAVAFLIPNDPVAKKKSDGKRPHAQISVAEGGNGKGSGTRLKNGVGRTGVEFRFYGKDEFRQLTEEQKKELFQWRADRDSKKKDKRKTKTPSKGKGKGKKLKGMVASLIKEAFAEHQKGEEEAKEQASATVEAVSAIISGAIKEHDDAKVSSEKAVSFKDDKAMAVAVQLQKLMKAGKGSQG